MNHTAPPAQPPRTRVLIVDDHTANREALARALNRHGHSIDTASDGAGALDKIATKGFDLVLLDGDMPDLDAIVLLGNIRAVASRFELPVIVIATLDDGGAVAATIDAGANDHLGKPVDFPLAQARLRNQLEMCAAHKKLQHSEQRYALAFRGANDGLWDWDLKNDRVYYSQRWKDMLGYAPEHVTEHPDDWFALVHPDELETLKKALNDHLLGHTEALEHEYRALHKDGSFRWLLTRGVASRDHDGQALRISGTQTDITRSKAYDPITLIPNKFLFMDRLEWLLDRERRKPHGRYAVFLIHIDRLNELRQTLGPVAGEEIIITAARRLNECLRAEDSVTRMSDGETATVSRHDEADFAILSEGCHDETTAPKLAERLRLTLTKPFVVKGESLVLTASIGIAAGAMEKNLEAGDVIAHAASALSRARQKGPGHFELFDQAMQQRAIARLQMETDLRRAVANGELALHYQPIVNLKNGEIVGCEALARWHHPERGNIPPAVFIPLAEKTGLIDIIGDWVLQEACTQHQKWCAGRTDKLDLSVNFSLLQMQRDGIEDRVMNILHKTGMDPCRLKIEITESIFMENMDRVKTILSKLNAVGIGIAIDDFGTGYSSLSYLSRLPITHLKIDRSFIGDISSDSAAQAIVQSTLLMAQSLGIEVIAEGIETTDQETFLKLLKAEYGQGYHFWQPISAHHFGTLLSPPSPI